MRISDWSSDVCSSDLIEQSFHWTEPPFDMRIDARTVLSVLGDIRPQIRFLRSKNVAIVHSNDGRTHATWALPARLAGAKLLWHHRGNPGARDRTSTRLNSSH